MAGECLCTTQRDCWRDALQLCGGFPRTEVSPAACLWDWRPDFTHEEKKKVIMTRVRSEEEAGQKLCGGEGVGVGGEDRERSRIKLRVQKEGVI